MCKSIKITKIKDKEQRDIEFCKYAEELGLNVDDFVNHITRKITNETGLIERILKVEHHNTNIRATRFAASVALVGILWSILYTFFIYPPKYVINSKDLLLKKDIQTNNAELKLHFILNNQHAGAGEISKPILVISSKTSKENYKISPDTFQEGGILKEGNTTTTQYNDTGRTFRVGQYGRIDEYIIYRVNGYNDCNKEILKFFKNSGANLEFKIKGYPYGELAITNIQDGNLYTDE